MFVFRARRLAPLALVLLGLAVLSPGAWAQKIEKPKKMVGIYVGAATAAEALDYAENRSRVALRDPSDFGLAYGGYAAMKYKGYAGEAGLLLRSDQELESDASTTTIERQVIYAAALFDLPPEYTKKPKITTFAKGGVAWWHTKSSDTLVFPVSESGFDPLVGVGANVQLGKKIAVRLEYMQVLATADGLSDRQGYYLLSGQYSW